MQNKNIQSTNFLKLLQFLLIWVQHQSVNCPGKELPMNVSELSRKVSPQKVLGTVRAVVGQVLGDHVRQVPDHCATGKLTLYSSAATGERKVTRVKS